MAQPHVIVFFTDTQRWDCSGLHGNPLDLMPNFDRLAMRGTHVANAFSPQPVCTPCRACLQTGMYGTQSGVYRNGIAIPFDAHTIAHSFNNAGYETAYIGKWHLANEVAGPSAAGAVPKRLRGGYQYWLGANAIELVSEPYDCVVWDEDDREVRLPGYRVDALVDAAVRYIDRPKDAPFFLFLSLLEPHTQNRLGTFCAPDGYRERYQGRWTPPDLAGLPNFSNGGVAGLAGGELAAQGLADYWGMVKRIDEALGRLMDALKSRGLAEDTIVLFTSDHGSHFNTRNSGGKCSGHDASIRVPTALWGGPFTGGGHIDEVVSLIDIPPTLLDACGIEIPAQMEGRSILPAVRGDRSVLRDDVFLQISQTEVGRCVRTKRWKYGVTAPDADGRRDSGAERYVDSYLYDMENDPYELFNLIGLESHAAVRGQMRERLRSRMAEIGEAPITIEDAPVRPAGQRWVGSDEVDG